MAISVLSRQQSLALKVIAASPLAKDFYFTGGTALAHFYLHHRRSEDLDFFNHQEFSVTDVTFALQTLKAPLGYKTIDVQTSLNRNIYQLRFNSGSFLKLELTYFPFTQVESPKKQDDLLVDSLIDIAVNKLFTIAQKPRGRDYYDLYAIEQVKHFGLEKLRQLAKQKFDWHVDPLQLGSQLSRVEELLDDPILTTSIPRDKLIKYFKLESQALKSQIIK